MFHLMRNWKLYKVDYKRGTDLIRFILQEKNSDSLKEKMAV